MYRELNEIQHDNLSETVVYEQVHKDSGLVVASMLKKIVTTLPGVLDCMPLGGSLGSPLCRELESPIHVQINFLTLCFKSW